MTRDQNDLSELEQSSEKLNTEGRYQGDFMQELHQMQPYQEMLQLDLKPSEIFSPAYEQVK